MTTRYLIRKTIILNRSDTRIGRKQTQVANLITRKT